MPSQLDFSKGSERSLRPVVMQEYVIRIKLILILVAMTMVLFVMMLDLSIIATAISHIINYFKSLLHAGWYGCAYQLASSSLQPLAGKLYTYIKTKWVFSTFFFILELGSLLPAVALSSVMLIAAQAVSGLGASGLWNGGLTTMSGCLPKERQPAMLGTMIAVGQLGQACSPLVGGALTEYSSWR